MVEYSIARNINLKECIELKNAVIKRLHEIGLNIWNENYPSDELFAADIASGISRIIKCNNEIVAYGVLDIAKNEFGEDVFSVSDVFSISRLMVKSELTGQNIGTFFVNKMIEEAANNGSKGIGVMVHPINLGAIKFYEKLGFKFDNRKCYAYGDFSTYIKIFDKN